MNSKMQSKDRDIRASLAALRRAARAAKRLAKATGTPVYIVKNGRVVNVNPTGRKRRSRSVRRRPRNDRL